MMARSPKGLGRVKTLEREEHVECASSLTQMSLPAIARQLGNRGADRIPIPSVNALSEFSHTQGHKQSKTDASMRGLHMSLLTSIPAVIGSALVNCRAATHGVARERARGSGQVDVRKSAAAP